ncbi:hypothetical protein VP01_290g1 [Puccinia sorghi]|uniref:Uncharacterized protein n=1 Tax=Puccinia sorghi TaxID=27349 RepID=A0A0L6V367_9BASI|nr:hypothetical protein VP01_290g1 [Puccinia sorghi]
MVKTSPSVTRPTYWARLPGCSAGLKPAAMFQPINSGLSGEAQIFLESDVVAWVAWLRPSFLVQARLVWYFLPSQVQPVFDFLRPLQSSLGLKNGPCYLDTYLPFSLLGASMLRRSCICLGSSVFILLFYASFGKKTSNRGFWASKDKDISVMEGINILLMENNITSLFHMENMNRIKQLMEIKKMKRGNNMNEHGLRLMRIAPRKSCGKISDGLVGFSVFFIGTMTCNQVAITRPRVKAMCTHCLARYKVATLGLFLPNKAMCKCCLCFWPGVLRPSKLATCSVFKSYFNLITHVTLQKKKSSVDMQHSTAKLLLKLHLFAYLDFLAQLLCSLHTDCAPKLASLDFLHVDCRQLSKFFLQNIARK